MRIAIAARVIAFSCLLLGAGGCGYSPDLVDRTVDYNDALAATTNDVLLLNIVRSSYRFPTVYSRLAANSATGTAGVAFGGPLSRSTTREAFNGVGISRTAEVAAASLGLSVGESNQFTLQSLDDQQSMQGVMSQIDPKLIKYYWDSSWPAELLVRVFFERLEIDKTSLVAIADAVATICNGNNAPAYCGSLGTPSTCIATKDDVAKIYSFANQPGDAESDCFIKTVRALLVLGFRPSAQKSFSVVYGRLPNAAMNDLSAILQADQNGYTVEMEADGKGIKGICKPKDNPIYQIHLENSPFAASFAEVTRAKDELKQLQGEKAKASEIKDAQKNVTDLKAGLAGIDDLNGRLSAAQHSPTGEPKSCADALTAKPAAAEPTGPIASRPHFVLAVRSVDSIIYYLGEVVREHRENGNALAVWSWTGSEPSMTAPDRISEEPLFEVSQSGSAGRNAISASFQGKTFSIHSDINMPVKDRSLQVLALLNQLWGLNKTAPSLAIVPPINVISQ